MVRNGTKNPRIAIDAGIFLGVAEAQSDALTN